MQTSIENFENIPLRKKARSVSSFLKKTFDLLNEPENQECIKWASNGIGFIVTDEDLFSKTVLPKYFKHGNYSSFVRQLNMYNFHKIRENNSESYFHHECFDRDNKSAIAQIKRKPEKKKRKNQESDYEKDENESISLRQGQPRAIFERNINEVEIVSQEGVSIRLIKQENDEKFTPEKITKGHLISETSYRPSKEENKCEEQKNNLTSEKNILSIQDDDRISINEEITEKLLIPRFNTKELFFPSTNNLFPFMGTIQPSTFSLFF